MTRHWRVNTYRLRLGLGLCMAVILWLSGPAQGQGSAQGTRHVANPAGTLTSPPSSHPGGLIPAPGPAANHANLLVTGNVSDAKHFRAALPYRPAHDFQATLESSYLDSFLRLSSQESAGALPSSGIYTPYYPISRSVTRTLPGRTDILSSLSLQRSMSRKSPTRASVDMPALPLRTADSPTTLLDYPLPDIGFAGDLLSLGQFAQALQADDPAAVFTRDDILSLQALSYLFDSDQGRDAKTDQQAAQPAPEDTENGLFESFLPTAEAQALLTPAGQVAEDPDGTEASSRVTPLQLLTRFQAQEASDRAGVSPLTASEPGNTDAAAGRDSSVHPATTEQAPAPTVSPLGTRRTLAAYTWSRYYHFMQEAESHLKQGRFSQAISAYKLAALHNPRDPLAAAGRSHALFAQGEFSSSALFLTRALKRRPEYAECRIDLPLLMGGQTAVHQRIQELEKHLAYSGAFDLQCLLAYISYQIGDLSRAQELIEAAQKKQPEDQAVLVLHKVIKKALN